MSWVATSPTRLSTPQLRAALRLTSCSCCLAARPWRDADWGRMTAHSKTEEIFDATVLGTPLLHIFWSTIHQQNILLPSLILCCGSETNALGHVLPHSYCVYKRYATVSSMEYDCQQLKWILKRRNTVCHAFSWLLWNICSPDLLTVEVQAYTRGLLIQGISKVLLQQIAKQQRSISYKWALDKQWVHSVNNLSILPTTYKNIRWSKTNQKRFMLAIFWNKGFWVGIFSLSPFWTLIASQDITLQHKKIRFKHVLNKTAQLLSHCDYQHCCQEPTLEPATLQTP